MTEHEVTAKIKYQGSIIRILKGLYPLPNEWPKRGVEIDPILRNLFTELQVVVKTYRTTLDEKEQEKIDGAWVKFYNAYGDHRCECYHHYMGFNSPDDDDAPDPKREFKKNVDVLLNPDKIEVTGNIVKKISAVSRKDEMQADMNKLADERKQAGKKFNKSALAYELNKMTKYQEIAPATIEKLTRATWKQKKR